MDNGVFASLKGYDGIRGGTRNDVYTVILNRTKVIILEDN
jgi:hypothetical protein